MDRQYNRATSAPANQYQYSSNGNAANDGKFSRASRKMKRSIAGFFGLDLDDDNNDKTQRWNNRRMRLYKGKVRDEYLIKADSDDFLESSQQTQQIKYIHDPYRKAGRFSEMSSRRTTPLSSTSTYARSKPGVKRLRKDSVIQMTWKGLRTIAGSRKKLRGKSFKHSASYDPARLADEYPDDLSASIAYQPHEDAISLVDDVFYDEPIVPLSHKMSSLREDFELPAGGWRRPPPRGLPSTPYDEVDMMPDFSMKRINPNIIKDEVAPDKRQVGMGFVGRLFNRSFRSDRMNSNVRNQIANVDDHRPYFTFWVTFVQILIFIVSVSVYGIAPIGVSETVYEDSVMMPNLAFEKVRYTENENLWIGPRQSDLIHLGAKYSPCMRRDANLYDGIALDRAEEKTTGCCIRNDGSGCVQTIRGKCSTTISEFKKYNSTIPSPTGFLTGAVCGQDPQYCRKPSSVAPFEWDKNDITNWPFCEDTSVPTSNTSIVAGDRHMNCEISGRPCCHGIQGECMITTREHCNFIRGYYHEDKFLCAQVKCFKQICGMIPFTADDVPDQFYRFFTSIFLHGGLFHLLITIGFQMLIMRDVEKLTGCIRMTIIYVGAGIAGNLASSTFLPYHVEVGPAGAQFGVLSCLLVEAIQSIQMLKRPCFEVGKLLLFILFLFILGLLPWIDNWAHLTGFVFGFLLAFAILPYISFGKFDKTRKCVMILFGLGGATILFVMLIILFYVSPIYNCPGCQYFNCIPITENFCKNMEVKINRQSTYSSYL